MVVELKVSEWLASRYLQGVARRVACTYHLSPEDVPDLTQELYLALWKAGPDQVVNATWVFHTAQHRAIELLKRERKRAQVEAAISKDMSADSDADHELASLVHARAARLPESLRRFYRLRYEEGFTQREIVQHKHLTRGSVRGMEKQCLRWMTGKRI